VLVGCGLGSVGCTADFLLGDGTGDTTVAADSGGSTTGPGGLASSGAEDPSADPSSATGGSSSAAGTDEVTGTPEPTTESATTAESATTTESATTESATTTETTTTETGGGGVLDCPDLANQRACEHEAPCDWYGEVCFADRCHPDAEAACNELGYDGCIVAPLCTWFGEPEAGECGITPCPELGFEPCSVAPGCAWLGDMELGECVVPECPACGELEEAGCLELPEDCTWLDVAAVCVPD
jgi:hypothetical protein